MLNHITIQGRLTRDPELRYTQRETPVASFRLAVERDFSKDKEVDYIDCVAWRSTAEFAQKYFFKGDMAIVSGKLQMREYTDKSGSKRTQAEVVADNLYFGQAKQKGNSDTRGRTAEAPVDVDAGDWNDMDDDGPLPWE